MRARRRTRLKVQGKIFFPEKRYEEECLVLDMSPDGAGLKSACSAALGSSVVLYVDGLGRFEGTIIRHDRLHVGVQFEYSKTTRERIAERIADYLKHGTSTHKSTRDSSRQAVAAAPHSFMLESGQAHPCDILDIALSGVSFKATAGPAIGERVFFGKSAWVVVRHTDVGFTVAFSDPGEPVRT